MKIMESGRSAIDTVICMQEQYFNMLRSMTFGEIEANFGVDVQKVEDIHALAESLHKGVIEALCESEEIRKLRVIRLFEEGDNLYLVLELLGADVKVLGEDREESVYFALYISTQDEMDFRYVIPGNCREVPVQEGARVKYYLMEMESAYRYRYGSGEE